MIHRIYSNNPQFKTLPLKAGMNVLVARKAGATTKRRTRNGAGKSSVIEILRFVFGGDCDKKSIFKDPELRHDIFGVEFDLDGQRISAERTRRPPGIE